MGFLAVFGTYLLAIVLIGDAVLSVKPPKFISRCLRGVNFPQDWWWALIGIKALAALGLIVGAVLNNPSITATVSVGVLGYFIFAIIAHIKANFVGKEFWVNCLGMTALSAVVLVFNVAAMG
ncbi:DoxX family protein [Corynebacterium sp. KPL3927]|uniref:DoxX family protein n=1 Tax=Corynebacterium sp. KPL3927 TaxID=3158324 RepID=UPI0032F01616